MFSKLAVRNVRRSFRDYGVYLLTLTFGGENLDQTGYYVRMEGDSTIYQMDTAAVDTILTANVTGTYGDLAYQWYRGDTPIDGAAGSTYELVADDVDTRISVWVTSSGNYVGTLKSAPVEVGKTVISGTPDIDLPDGVMTPVVGTKLTIDDGGLEEGVLAVD